MKPEDYSEQNLEVAGWPIHLVSYKLGDEYLAKIDNVSPGAQIARSKGATKQEAEEKAQAKAKERLEATRRLDVNNVAG